MMFWDRTIGRAVPQVAALGYDVLEIWAEHLWRDDEDPCEIARALARANLRCTVHCPIMDVNLTSPNRGIREESLRQTLQSVELCDVLGAELLVVHPGKLFSVKNSTAVFWEHQLQALEVIVRHAEKYGVRLAFENMDAHAKLEVVKRAEDIHRALATFTYEKLGVTYDTTHLGTTRANLDFIAAVHNIIHVHLSDALIVPPDEVRTHLPLGEGGLDVEAILRALLPRYQGIFSLETYIPASEDSTPVLQEWKKLEALLDQVL
jgi:sugar phosphate isomerase/epimerase